jgi:hypothetical protein
MAGYLKKECRPATSSISGHPRNERLFRRAVQFNFPLTQQAIPEYRDSQQLLGVAVGERPFG